MPKATYMGQKILFRTVLFGKDYYWMEDGDGVVYLAKVGENNEPVFV